MDEIATGTLWEIHESMIGKEMGERTGSRTPPAYTLTVGLPQLSQTQMQPERPQTGDTKALEEAINSQFVQGLDRLHDWDHHFLLQGQQAVQLLSVMDQKNWLAGIQSAWEMYDNSKAREIQGMQNLMDHWLLDNASS